MKRFMFFFLVFIIPISIYSQEETYKHRIDIELDECLNDEFTISTVDIMICMDNALNEWDKELNVVYKQLMKILDDDQKAALKAAQREWIKYRDLEYANIDSIYNLDGTMWGQVRLSERLDILRSRVLSLSGYLSVLSFE